MSEVTVSRADTRSAIIDAGAHLLRTGGPAAMTTRGVAQRAGVQAPAIYRLFGDKDGLLEAVAEHVMAAFVSDKAAAAEAATASDLDPVEDLRESWRKQIDFGLANPAVFRLLSDPDRVVGSAAAQAGQRILATRVHRLAMAGRLRVTEARAAGLIQAAGVGVVQSLLATPVQRRDPALAEAMLDTVLGHILDDTPASAPDATIAAAVALRAHTPRLEALSRPEQQLLSEWLDKITTAATSRR